MLTEIRSKDLKPCAHAIYRVRNTRWLEFMKHLAETIMSQMIRQGASFTSGVLCLAESGRLVNELYKTGIGSVPSDRLEDLMNLASRRANIRGRNHLSRGTVRCSQLGDLIIAFASDGTPEEDTALVLAVGVRSGELPRDNALDGVNLPVSEQISRHQLWAGA